MEVAYNNLVRVIKKYPLSAVLIAALIFIIFIVSAGIYANALVYNETTINGLATGMGVHQSVSGTFIQYDTKHYIQIAKYGYVQKTDAAFFPLYPLIIRAVERVTKISYAWTSIIISWAALCLAAIVLFKWIELELNKLNQKMSPWFAMGVIAIFPTAFFFGMPYTESLFLLLNVAALYTFRKGYFLPAAAFAALSALTHDQGVLLVIFFSMDFWLSKKHDYKKIIPIVGCILGLAIFMLFLKIHYGSFFEFLTAEKSWGRLRGNFILNLIKSFRPFYTWYVGVSLLGLYAVYKYLGTSYFVYSLIFTLLPLTTGSFDSLNRLEVSVVPLFLGLAILINKIPNFFRYLYVASSIFLFAWSIMLFVNGYWVG
jgi:hypothetical protein